MFRRNRPIVGETSSVGVDVCVQRACGTHCIRAVDAKRFTYVAGRVSRCDSSREGVLETVRIQSDSVRPGNTVVFVHNVILHRDGLRLGTSSVR